MTRDSLTDIAIGVLFIILVLAAILMARDALAQPASSPSLETALLAYVQLEYERPDGSHPFAASCRRQRRGCAVHIAELVRAFERASEATGVDAWLLAAIAARESALTSDVVGAAGEHGPMQLHPRSPWGREAARQCRIAPSDCDVIEIEVAARLLAQMIERCGSEAAALGAYNRGQCGETNYSRAVLRLRDELRAGGAT